MADAIEEMKTAPADRSFIFLIVSFFSLETRSAVFSIAELINSKAKTKAIQKIMIIHSIVEIFKINPAINTQQVIKR